MIRPPRARCPDLFVAPYNVNPVLVYQGGQLWQYLKTIGVYRCPLDLTNTVNFKARVNKLSTYVENGAICGFGTVKPDGNSYKQIAFRQDAFMMWSRTTGLPATVTTTAPATPTQRWTAGWEGVTARPAALS